jgi:acyl-CoA reductase-like NAD-dependent aldehyde dehydrogenase
MWEGGFRDSLKEKVNGITVGPCTEWGHFTGPVINKPAFERITGIIEEAKQAGGEVLAGGDGKLLWPDSSTQADKQPTRQRDTSSSLPLSSPRTPSLSP